VLGRTKKEEKVEEEDETNKKEGHQWAPRMSMHTFEKAKGNMVRIQWNDLYKPNEEREKPDPLKKGGEHVGQGRRN